MVEYYHLAGNRRGRGSQLCYRCACFDHGLSTRQPIMKRGIIPIGGINHMKKIARELEAKIVQLYEDGARPTDIAKDLNVVENTVQRVLDRNGIARRGPTRRRLKSYQQVEIGNRYESGENPTQLAEEFGISVT